MSWNWHRFAMTMLCAVSVFSGVWLGRNGLDALIVVFILVLSALWAVIDADKKRSLEREARAINRDYLKR